MLLVHMMGRSVTGVRMSRFDNRSKNQFKKDIYFGTKLEKYFFDKFAKSYDVKNIRDNGIGNDGEYIESGVNTSGADYMVDIPGWNDLPLEVKWVPTYGKFTLKVNDLRAYIKEGAAILFIYTSQLLPLRKPRDHNLENHINLIESNHMFLRWGIMFPDKVEHFLKSNKNKIERVFYMGNKECIILKQEEFYDWFKEERFK